MEAYELLSSAGEENTDEVPETPAIPAWYNYNIVSVYYSHLHNRWHSAISKKVFVDVFFDSVRLFRAQLSSTSRHLLSFHADDHWRVDDLTIVMFSSGPSTQCHPCPFASLMHLDHAQSKDWHTPFCPVPLVPQFISGSSAQLGHKQVQSVVHHSGTSKLWVRSWYQAEYGRMIGCF